MPDPGLGFEHMPPTSAYSPLVSNAPGSPIRPVHGPILSVEPNAPRDPEFAALLRKGAQAYEIGNVGEAEECFRRALGLGERTLDPHDPDLIILLNDLTRLYLKQSAFAAAEPLLLRLLDLKRGKGENHPEVATVLASLATVHQALGRHDSAEQLWRRVLEIREATLAPNHFAIAIALEHLGDSCAARGKIREAMAALERAQAIRSRTLGPEHPSLRVLRERIADLELQASEDSLGFYAGADAGATPDRYRLLSGSPTTSSSVSKPPAEIARPIERTPAFKVSRAMPADKPEENTAKHDDVRLASPAALQTAAVLPYQAVLETIRDEMDAPARRRTLGARASAIWAAAVASARERHVATALVASVIVILLVGGAASTRAWESTDGPGLGATQSSVTPNAPSTTKLSSNASERSVTLPAIVAAPIEKPVIAHVREADDRAASKRVVEKKAEPKPIAIPTLSNAISSRLDSVVSKAASAPTQKGEAFAVPVAPPPVAGQRASFADTDQPVASQRARLIGELPTPKVPSSVADVQGEVVVRFTVGTDGHPVMSTFTVLNSPNPFLTGAVRKEIPTLRFEPARSGGSDPKPVTDIVEIAFRFARVPR